MEESLRELLQVTARRFGLLNKNCCSVGTNDISMIQSHILYEIDRQHEPSMQQIADTLGIDITTFSRQVQTLIKKNLVKKTTLPEDRRVYILHLTTEGKFVATTIDENMNSYLNEIFSFMNEFERETVLRSIKLLNESMLKSDKCCTPMG
ncbi:MarR family winged helix-turn-helix transcriptional regulator [Paenibacillus provencensis]|uniref:MarR family winged helix-turn-helix transcriptional regulator n=1 Tax=Paenibacillus provencensis TaxID=441151 RepID=A0ABW3PSL9_9BACL|nr:MarR family winged helix-turn-helix transcriptional regulator [Paenibacillus sp. MER 78]MCM3127148.1 MarR family winged helix-turn-helix transcriptional regulator [Paenibacillus sp. MER 78]